MDRRTLLRAARLVGTVLAAGGLGAVAHAQSPSSAQSQQPAQSQQQPPAQQTGQPQPSPGSQVLRIVPHAALTVLDPMWTTAYISRNHGYMVYDTLFGMDAAGAFKPQMVERWTVSPDRLTWTFTLRDGLAFHDGAPVTGEDVIASLKRWSARDAMGQKLASFVKRWEAVDATTFRIVLREPYGLVIDSLGKPSSNVPFIMPRRVAETDPAKQIDDYTGSGPYVFVRDQYRPGERAVYARFDRYRPRAEPPSGTAGGKNVYVDRIEWVFLRDPQTQQSALLAGEVDIVEQPAFEQYASLKAQPSVEVINAVSLGYQYMLRFNHLQPPFDDAAIRRAAMVALGQEGFLKAQVGTPGLYRYCRSIYPCGTPLASDDTGFYTGMADPARAKKMLQQTRYKGEPVVIMQPTDLAAIAKLPVVATQQLRQAGFTVDLQSMNWATLLARRAKKVAPRDGGWNVFLTAWTSADLLNPIANAALTANGDKGWFGWVDDPELERLRDAFARAGDEREKKALAEKVQLRALEIGTHANLGEYQQPAAIRKGVVSGIVPAAAQVYWNVRKAP